MKVYKNVNMIRTNHNVSRIIKFDAIDDLLMFVGAYNEHFESLCNICKDDDKWILYFTIKAENWDKIEKEEKKNIIRDTSRWNDRKRFWSWKEES